MQTRLSPLEEIHKQELASGKKQGEAMVKVGGCRVPRHVSWASGFVQGLKLQWKGGGGGYFSRVGEYDDFVATFWRE